ncbi:MAG: lamin tail domain-containing protein [Pseudomonadota bacterium]
MKLHAAAFAILASCTLVACSDSSTPEVPNAVTPAEGAQGPAGNTAEPAAPPSDVFRPNGLVINELMRGLFAPGNPANRDDTGREAPWLELYNGGDTALNLDGYAVRTSGRVTRSWPLPAVELDRGGHLRLWGSGDERSALHAGVPIMGQDTLALVHPDGSVVDRVGDTGKTGDRSWGRYPDGSDTTRYYDTPSPGRPNPGGGFPFVLNCDRLSLTAGSPHRLRTFPDLAVTWSSSNPMVRVDAAGWVTTTATGAARDTVQAVISATDNNGNAAQCRVSVVNWVANRSRLEVTGYPNATYLLNYSEGAIHAVQNGQLTTADDGFKRVQPLAPFPRGINPPLLLNSPQGHFANQDSDIYTSRDKRTWTRSFAMRHVPLQHGFARHVDRDSGVTYLYAGDYSVRPDAPHAVYRGVSTGGNTQWDTILSFAPAQLFDRDNRRLDTIRHVHVVAADPYTGHVWVGTGDLDQHARLYVSTDRGDTFTLFAIGAQRFRTLSIWFTPRYVYWNMDSERADQRVFRVPRSAFEAIGAWPSLTPELSSGLTEPGVRYLVSATEGSWFPTSTGRFFVETTPRALSADERVYAVDSPQFDYAEEVANLTHSAQWYHLWVTDQQGDDVLLMATNAEGTPDRLRDHNSRVFGFKERADGTVDVQELLLFPSDTPDQPNRYTQLVPGLQDGGGSIYFRGRRTQRRIYRMELDWVDRDP